MFEPELFRKQMYCIIESTRDIVGIFQRPPQSFGAPTIFLINLKFTCLGSENVSNYYYEKLT